jgi:PAS domain-containing protein
VAICVPVADLARPGGVAGVLAVAWDRTARVSPGELTLLRTAASMAGVVHARLELARATTADRFRRALDAMIDSVAIAVAVRDTGGHIVDFRIEHMNRVSVDGAGRTAEQIVGRTVTDLYPHWRESGVLARMVDVVETGEPLVAERMHYTDTVVDGTTIDGWWNLRVTRFGDGYLAAWRDVTEVVVAEQRDRAARDEQARARVALQVLQRAALPAGVPQADGVRFDAEYAPASNELVVGGDWYDVIDLGGGSYGLVIADVAGHGTAAAVYMVQVRNWMHALALAAERVDPGTLLSTLNGAMVGLDQPFVTCCLAVVDSSSGTLRWATAGHPPPLVVGNQSRLLRHPHVGPPLGVIRSAVYRTHEDRLRPGEVLVLYTDGLVERRREHLDVGLARLMDECRTLRPAGLTARRLLHAILGDGGADDDVAVVMLELADVPEVATGPLAAATRR